MSTEEVDAVDGEAEALALAQSGPGGEHEQCSVTDGDGGGERLDLADAEWDDLGVSTLREGDADAGRRGDEPIPLRP
jgi:hypothetical protein